MRSSPQLWSVDCTVTRSSLLSVFGSHKPLWILAATASIAERKARRALRSRGYGGITINSITNQGEIDSF